MEIIDYLLAVMLLLVVLNLTAGIAYETWKRRERRRIMQLIEDMELKGAWTNKDHERYRYLVRRWLS